LLFIHFIPLLSFKFFVKPDGQVSSQNRNLGMLRLHSWPYTIWDPGTDYAMDPAIIPIQIEIKHWKSAMAINF